MKELGAMICPWKRPGLYAQYTRKGAWMMGMLMPNSTPTESRRRKLVPGKIDRLLENVFWQEGVLAQVGNVDWILAMPVASSRRALVLKMPSVPASTKKAMLAWLPTMGMRYSM